MTNTEPRSRLAPSHVDALLFQLRAALPLGPAAAIREYRFAPPWSPRASKKENADATTT